MSDGGHSHSESFPYPWRKILWPLYSSILHDSKSRPMWMTLPSSIINLGWSLPCLNYYNFVTVIAVTLICCFFRSRKLIRPFPFMGWKLSWVAACTRTPLNRFISFSASLTLKCSASTTLNFLVPFSLQTGHLVVLSAPLALFHCRTA